MKSSGLFLFLSVALSFASCARQTDPDSLANFVRRQTDSIFARSKVPGILVFYQDKSEKGFYTKGFADPASRKVFDDRTIFEIGSITKTFTAYVLMSVLRDHKISDSAFILPYLPVATRRNSRLSQIRFINLLNHTSGLPRLPGNMPLQENDLQPYATYDSTKLFEYLPIAVPATDGAYDYSNLGAGLAGVLAERISKKTYSALVRHYILVPFGMTDHTNMFAKPGNQSQGFIDDSTKALYWDMNVLGPAGGIKSNAREMSGYLENLSRPVGLESKVIRDSLTALTYRLSGIVGIGRGWHTLARKNKPVVYWHNGGTYGFSTFAAFVKDSGQWVMVVVNMFDKNDTVADLIGMKVISKMLE